MLRLVAIAAILGLGALFASRELTEPAQEPLPPGGATNDTGEDMIYRRDELTASQAAAADSIVAAAVASPLDINPAFMLALAVTESSLRPSITGDDGISIGLFQLQVRTAKQYEPSVNADDLLDAETNARLAMRYIGELLHDFPGHTWGEYAEAWTLGGHGKFNLKRNNPHKLVAMQSAITFLALPLNLNERSL